VVNLVSDRGSNPRASTVNPSNQISGIRQRVPLFLSLRADEHDHPRRSISPLPRASLELENEIHVWQTDSVRIAQEIEQRKISRELLAHEPDAERVNDVIV
jgi:hypothetical protein